jgi:hypothetical protein
MARGLVQPRRRGREFSARIAAESRLGDGGDRRQAFQVRNATNDTLTADGPDRRGLHARGLSLGNRARRARFNASLAAPQLDLQGHRQTGYIGQPNPNSLGHASLRTPISRSVRTGNGFAGLRPAAGFGKDHEREPSMVRRPKDVYAGAIFIGIGASAFVLAQQYDIGTASHMGAGYLPALMGLVLIVLGAFSLANAVRSKVSDPIARQALEPFVLVVASVTAFALLIDSAGLIVALFALVFLSCMRRVFSHPFEVLFTYLGLTAFCIGLFAHGLNMPMPLWWR